MKLRCIGTELYFILFSLTKKRKILYPGSLRFEKKNELTIMQMKISQLYNVASTSDNVTVSLKQMLRVSPRACALCFILRVQNMSPVH